MQPKVLSNQELEILQNGEIAIAYIARYQYSLDSKIACLREPAPPSFVLVTIKSTISQNFLKISNLSVKNLDFGKYSARSS